MKRKKIKTLACLMLGITVLTAGTKLSASAGDISSSGNIIMRSSGADGRAEKVIEVCSEDIRYLNAEIETLKKQL